MTRLEIQKTALELPPRERQELAETLWASLERESAPLPDWQRQLIDDRLAALENKPEDGVPWEEVERRVWPEAK